MSFEIHSVEVIGFSFHPVGARKDWCNSICDRIFDRKIGLQAQPLISDEVMQLIYNRDLIQIGKMNATNRSEILEFRFRVFIEIANDLRDLFFL